MGDLAEMDDVRPPFKCYNKAEDKPIRPTLFCIIDVHSAKITAWHLDDTQTRCLIGGILKKQAETGWFPCKIFTDNFSPKDTPEYLDLYKKLEKRGVHIAYCRPGNPQGKPHIERFNGTFQDRFCREYPDWLGMDVKSKSKENRPNPEALKAHYKKHGYPTFEQMYERIGKLIEEYNNTSFDGRPTPNQLFEASQRPNAVLIPEYEVPFLFWLTTTCKVNRQMLTVEVNTVPYLYQLDSPAFNGQTLVVKYDPQDMGQVHICHNDAEETPIGSLEQYLEKQRTDLKTIGKAHRRAEKDKDLALAAPHLTPKEELQEAEDELLEELYPMPTADKGLYWKGFVPGASLPQVIIEDE